MPRIIDEIKEVTKDRGRDYGHPFPNFLRIAIGKTQFFDGKMTFTPETIALENVVQKLERHKNTPKWDNLRDIVGYIDCLDRICKRYCERRFPELGDFWDLEDAVKDKILTEIRGLSYEEQIQLLREENARTKEDENPITAAGNLRNEAWYYIRENSFLSEDEQRTILGSEIEKVRQELERMQRDLPDAQ